MLKSLVNKAMNTLSPRTRGVALTVGGMGTLLMGGKLSALGMTVKGLRDIEDAWRDAHPEFTGDLRDRWREAVEFYEATHKDPMNRRLHIIGIPMIVGGAAGLLIFPSYTPPWALAAGTFAGGWALNIVGHALYEKNAPAFADDPLSFIAGPVFDVVQLKGIASRVLRRKAAA